MVSWINVQRAINDNTERAFSVEKLLLTEPSVTYERFPIVRLPLRAPAPVVAPAPLAPAPLAPAPVLPVVAPAPQLQISSEEEEDLIQPPPPSSRPAIKIPAAVPEFLEPYTFETLQIFVSMWPRP